MPRLKTLAPVLGLLLALAFAGRAHAQYPTAYGSCNGGSGYGYPPAPYSVSGSFSYAPPAGGFSLPQMAPPSVYASPPMPYAQNGYSFAPPSPYGYPRPGYESQTYSLPYEYERRYGLRGQLRFERYSGQPLVGGGRVICTPGGQCYVVR